MAMESCSRFVMLTFLISPSLFLPSSSVRLGEGDALEEATAEFEWRDWHPRAAAASISDESADRKPEKQSIPGNDEHEHDAERQKRSHDICILDPPPPFRLGFKKEDWLPVSFEIEFFAKDKDETYDGALKKFKDRALGSVARDLTTKCAKKVFTVEKDSDEESWMFEMEKDVQKGGGGKASYCKEHFCEKGRKYPTMFEASTPQALEENETEIALVQSTVLERFFSEHAEKSYRRDGELTPFRDEFGVPDPPGLHVHVQSRCLLKDTRRLVALLLIWEKFGSLIYKLVGTKLHVGKGKSKAASIGKKTPALLKHLLSYMTKDGWAKNHAHNDQKLGEMFTEHESNKTMGGDKTKQDGFRRFEVNVCHLLHVKCSHDVASKNKVPKFGGLEFRGFDPMVGEPLRLVVMLVQRLVQFSCSTSLDDRGKGSLHKLAYFNGDDDGAKDLKDLAELFGALELNPKHFHTSKFSKAKFAQEDF